MDPLRIDRDAARAAVADLHDKGGTAGAALQLATFYDQLTRPLVLDPVTNTYVRGSGYTKVFVIIGVTALT